MCLVFDWGNCTSLNPINVIGEFGLDEVGDLVEVLDSTFFILIFLTSGLDVTLDGLVLFFRPVGELVVAKGKVLPISAIMLVDKLVVMYKPLKSNRILLHVRIDLVKAGGVVDELELVGTDGSGSRCEGRESEGFHL